MYLIHADGEVFAARTVTPLREVHKRNSILNYLVDTYNDRCTLHRVMTDSLEEVKRLFPTMSALVIFP